MAEHAHTTNRRTDLAIVREITRITHRIAEAQATDLEIALFLAHMGPIVSEYLMLREELERRVNPAPAEYPQPHGGGSHLRLVTTEEPVQ